MISGLLYFDRLPTEILQTGIFPYLGYYDLCSLRYLNHRSLKEMVDYYIFDTPGTMKNCALGHENWFKLLISFDNELINNMNKVILQLI